MNEEESEQGSTALLYTCVVFDKLLQCVKLRPRGDVVTPVVKLADLVVFHVVPLGFVPVSYGERISTWQEAVNAEVTLFTPSLTLL